MCNVMQKPTCWFKNQLGHAKTPNVHIGAKIRAHSGIFGIVYFCLIIQNMDVFLNFEIFWNFCKNRIASLHHVTNLNTVLQKSKKSVTLSSRNHIKVQHSHYKTMQIWTLLGAPNTKPHQFRRYPPMSSHKPRKFGHFSTVSVILII